MIMSKSQWLAFHLMWFACVTYMTENYVLPCQVPGMVLISSMRQTNIKIRTSLKYDEVLTQNILILKKLHG